MPISDFKITITETVHRGQNGFRICLGGDTEGVFFKDFEELPGICRVDYQLWQTIKNQVGDNKTPPAFRPLLLYRMKEDGVAFIAEDVHEAMIFYRDFYERNGDTLHSDEICEEEFTMEGPAPLDLKPGWVHNIIELKHGIYTSVEGTCWKCWKEATVRWHNGQPECATCYPSPEGS